MDIKDYLTRIPRAILWFAIAIFVIVVLYLIYSYYITSYLPPYLKYFSYSCQFNKNESIVIITAKENIHNVTVYNFFGTSVCYIGDIGQGSMDGCVVENSLVAGEALVKVYYTSDSGKTYVAVLTCSVPSSGLLSWILR
ncbi:MAG: hypothetical protein ACPLX8_02330 [Nanopusillaceae archaeon]